jgi:hypothetical protein
MTTERIRWCGCGAILLARSPALVCCFECMAAEFGGTILRSVLASPTISEATKAKLAAQVKGQSEGFDAIAPPSAIVTDFPSKYVESTRYWERRDGGLIDPATILEEGPEEWPQAVSQAQVYWARNQLRKAKNGASVPQSIAELEALANTPLAGLPERAGQKKPAKQAKVKAEGEGRFETQGTGGLT